MVKQAAGSAYVEVGGSAVLCSVHGPRAIKHASELSESGTLVCTARLAPFSQYDEHGLSARELETLRVKSEQRLSTALQRAIEGSVRLERFPKSMLEIHVLVLCDDGQAACASVVCASLALANSGVELFDLVPCAMVAVLGDAAAGAAASFLPAPTLAQRGAPDCVGTMRVALMPASETVTDLAIDGALSFHTAGEASKQCFQECVRVHKLMKDHLLAAAEQAEAELLANT